MPWVLYLNRRPNPNLTTNPIPSWSPSQSYLLLICCDSLSCCNYVWPVCLFSLLFCYLLVGLFIYLLLPHWQTTRQINICAVNYIWFRYFNAWGTWDLLRRLCCPAAQCWPYNSRSNNTKLTIATSHLLPSAPSTAPALWQLMRNKMWSGYYYQNDSVPVPLPVPDAEPSQAICIRMQPAAVPSKASSIHLLHP